MLLKQFLALSLIPLLLISSSAHATPQQVPYLFERLWGGSQQDFATSITPVGQGNFLVSGQTEIFGNNRTFILKIDSGGNLVWQRTWSGPGFAWPGNLAADYAGNAYVAGYTAFLDNSNHVFLVKIDGNGNLVWQELLDGLLDGRVAVDPLGNALVTGYTFGSVVLLKIDPSGPIIWQRSWREMDVRAYAVATDHGGNALVTGRINDTGSGNQGALVLKFDPSGKLVWQRVWGVNGDTGQGISSDLLGNVYVTGYHNTPLGAANQDAFILKISPSGDLVWQRTWSGGRSNFPANVGAQFLGYGVVTNSSGNVFATGSATVAFSSIPSDTCACMFILELDSTGAIVSQKIWGGHGNAGGRAIALNPSGGVVISGIVDHGLHYTIGTSNFPIGTPTFGFGVPMGLVSNATYTLVPVQGSLSTPAGTQNYAGGNDAFFLFLPAGNPQLVVYEGFQEIAIPGGQRNVFSLSIEAGNDLVYNASVTISSSDPSLVPLTNEFTNSESYGTPHQFDAFHSETLSITVNASEPGFTSVLDQRQFGVGPSPPFLTQFLIPLLLEATALFTAIAALAICILLLLRGRRIGSESESFPVQHRKFQQWTNR
ncbi:MAG TPA: hypothetical protein VGS11_09885 [Candidatus Bathyarchaeia archaeon]|nr:hypothetical protein [Candidatus Bathyarchaeia archaeon]